MQNQAHEIICEFKPRIEEALASASRENESPVRELSTPLPEPRITVRFRSPLELVPGLTQINLGNGAQRQETEGAPCLIQRPMDVAGAASTRKVPA